MARYGRPTTHIGLLWYTTGVNPLKMSEKHHVSEGGPGQSESRQNKVVWRHLREIPAVNKLYLCIPYTEVWAEGSYLGARYS